MWATPTCSFAPAESFAEAAMFADGKFPVCAEAVTDGRIMTLTADGFARCLREDDRIAFGMLGEIRRRIKRDAQLAEGVESL